MAFSILLCASAPAITLLLLYCAIFPISHVQRDRFASFLVELLLCFWGLTTYCCIGVRGQSEECRLDVMVSLCTDLHEEPAILSCILCTHFVGDYFIRQVYLVAYKDDYYVLICIILDLLVPGL